MAAYGSNIIIIAILLLSIAMGAGILTNYFKIPYASMLVFIGLIVGVFRIFPHLKITPAIIYYVFLPLLIFEGASKINIEDLKDNLFPISVYAIIGTIVTTLLIGACTYFLLGIPLQQSLLFGAIISPTDPLSIMALLEAGGKHSAQSPQNNQKTVTNEPEKKSLKSGGIKTIIKGESLLNDGVSLVLFELFLNFNFQAGTFHMIGDAALRFMYIFLGGAAVGIGAGFLISFILSFTYDYLTEIMISLLLAYLSIIVSYYLGVSFIISIILSGIILANFGFKKTVTERTVQVFPIVIEFLSFVLNSLIFLIIGIEINLFKILNIWLISIFLVLIVIFSRGFSIYALSPLINAVRSKFKTFSKISPLDNKYKNLMIFGGLRGALSIAMALSLPLDMPMRTEIITFAFIIVLFSLTFQAIIFDIIVKKLKI